MFIFIFEIQELLEKDDKKEDIYIKILNEFKEDSIISLKYIINRVKLSNLNENSNRIELIRSSSSRRTYPNFFDYFCVFLSK
jgi:hypothetical protein